MHTLNQMVNRLVNHLVKCVQRALSRSNSFTVIENIVCDLILVCHCNYSCILCNFRVIRRCIVTLKRRFGVTRGHRKWHTSSFLFIFHCDYSRLLYRFRNKASGRKTDNFYTPSPFNLRDRLQSLGILPNILIQTCPSPWAIKRCKNIAENFNRLSQTTDIRNDTWEGRKSLLVELCLYLALNNGVTLNFGFGVVQGHWKLRRSTDHFLLAGRPL